MTKEASKSKILRSEWAFVARWAVHHLAEKVDILSQNAPSRTQFFHLQATIQVISRQYNDKPVIYCRFSTRILQLLSDERKLQGNFANKEGTNSKFSEQRFFLLCAKADFNVSLEWCRGCSHCEFEIGSFWLNSHKTRIDSTRKKRFMRVEASQSYAKPRKALLRPAVQWRLCLTVPVSAQRRFLCAAFSKLPKDPGIPCENTVYLTSTSRGVRCGGACAATKTSRNPWMRCGLTRIVLQQPLYGLKCSSMAS